jgi:hypothetical protein
MKKLSLQIGQPVLYILLGIKYKGIVKNIYEDEKMQRILVSESDHHSGFIWITPKQLTK